MQTSIGTLPLVCEEVVNHVSFNDSTQTIPIRRGTKKDVVTPESHRWSDIPPGDKASSSSSIEALTRYSTCSKTNGNGRM
ncbi:hypothetical protein HDU76_002688, partial [Blyttiomyces sp. JEL0837]